MLCFNSLLKKFPSQVFCEPICRSASTQMNWGVLVDKKNEISKWKKLNEEVFEPTPINGEQRPAYVCHEKRDIWYSFKKLYIVSCFVRGLSVDDAVKQLNFVSTKGAKIVKDTILEAQAMAVKDHNVEFKSNLWVAESFPEKAYCLQGYRRNARSNLTHVKLQHCHYFVRLEEGKPPEHYYHRQRPRSPQELLDEWVQELRNRKITNSL